MFGTFSKHLEQANPRKLSWLAIENPPCNEDSFFFYLSRMGDFTLPAWEATMEILGYPAISKWPPFQYPPQELTA